MTAALRGNARLLALSIPLICIALAGLLAPVIAPYAPNQTDLTITLQAPSAEHWLGTDQLGRGPVQPDYLGCSDLDDGHCCRSDDCLHGRCCAWFSRGVCRWSRGPFRNLVDRVCVKCPDDVAGLDDSRRLGRRSRESHPGFIDIRLGPLRTNCPRCRNGVPQLCCGERISGSWCPSDPDNPAPCGASCGPTLPRFRKYRHRLNGDGDRKLELLRFRHRATDPRMGANAGRVPPVPGNSVVALYPTRCCHHRRRALLQPNRRTPGDRT
jgi:hypothetical protein